MDNRYMGVLVECRTLFPKINYRKYSSARHQPKILLTRIFPDYKTALHWLREVSDKELRNSLRERHARYIRPIDLQSPQA